MAYRNKVTIKALVVIAIFITWTKVGLAQVTSTYADAWVFIHADLKLNERWTLGNELHWRNTRFLKDKEQMLIRSYADYHANEIITLSGGYTYARSYPYRQGDYNITRPEHNIWEQLTLHHKSNEFMFLHRYRFEHRFQGVIKLPDEGRLKIDEYDLTNRFRYRFTVKHPIGEKHFIHAFDELWIGAEGDFKNASFDRNWMYLGIGRTINVHSNIQVAYLHQSIQLKVPILERHSTLQVTYQHHFATQ